MTTKQQCQSFAFTLSSQTTPLFFFPVDSFSFTLDAVNFYFIWVEYCKNKENNREGKARENEKYMGYMVQSDSLRPRKNLVESISLLSIILCFKKS